MKNAIFSPDLYVFWGQGIHFWHFHRAAMFAWPRNSGSTSGSTSDFCVNRGYCGFGCIYFCYFNILNVFEVKESVSRSFTELACLSDLEKSRSTSGFTGPQGYWWLGLMDFRNFFITYIFEVKESISCSFAKLLCLSDLENPGQLPVLQVLKGTDDWVL